MEGEFELKDLREGEIYTVEISYVGYKSIQSEFTASKETKSLIFNLENSGFYLNEMVVSGTDIVGNHKISGLQTLHSRAKLKRQILY